MNKKGVMAFGVIIMAVLAIFAIGFGISYIGTLKKFVDQLLDRGNQDEDFVPVNLTLEDEQLIVDDSMRSLVFAINTIAAGEGGGVTFENPVPEGERRFAEAAIKEVEVSYEVSAQKPSWAVAFFSNLATREFVTKNFFKKTDAAGYLNTLADFREEPTLKEGPKDLNVNNMNIKVTYDSEFGEGLNKVDGGWVCEQKTTNDKKGVNSLPTWETGDDCRNSESYLQCPGVKVYYCGNFMSTLLAEEISPVVEKGMTTNYIKSFVEFNDDYTTAVVPDITTNQYGIRASFSADTEGLNGKNVASGMTDISVSCTDEECVVHNFELPQKIDRNMYNPTNWVAGKLDPRWLVYYEAFPSGPESFWRVDGISAGSVALVVGFLVIDIAPFGIGKVIKVFKGFWKGGKKITEEVVKDVVEETSKGTTKTLTRTVTKSAQEFFEDAQHNGVESAFRNQYIKSSLKSGYRGVGDKTADKVLAVSGKYLKDLKFDLTGTKIIGRFSNKPVAEIKDELAERILPTIRTSVKNKNYIPGGFSGTLDDYHKYLAKEMAGEIVDKSMIRLTDETITKMARRMRISSFLKEVFVNEKGVLDEVLLKDNLEKVGKRIANMDEASQKKILVEAGGMLDELMDSAGANKALTKDEDLALTKQFLEFIGKEESDSAVQKGMATVAKMAEGAKLGTVGSGKVSWLLDILPTKVVKALREGRSIKAYSKELIAWGKKYNVPDEYVQEYIKSLGSPSALNEMLGWVQRHRYLITLGVVMNSVAEDAANEKFRPVGVNSLGVDKASVLGSPREYGLTEEALRYFVTNRIHQNFRFYAASPCKADLIVRKEPCECIRLADQQHYLFSKGDYPMDVNGIEIDFSKLDNDEFVDEYIQKTIPYYYERVNDEREMEISKNALLSAQATEIRSKYPLKELSELKSNEEILREDFRFIILKSCDSQLYEPYFEKSLIKRIKKAHTVYDQRDAGKLEFVETEIPFPEQAWETCQAFLNINGAQKICSTPGKSLYWEGYTEGASTSYPYPAQCITIQYDRAEGYNDDYNYCIDEYSAADSIRMGFFAMEIAASFIVTAVTGGAAAPVMIVGATTGLFSGIADILIDLDSKWPAVNTQAYGNDDFVIVGDAAEVG